MKTAKSLLIVLLLIGAAYQAHAYYQYRKAADAVPPTVKTVKARGGKLRLTLSGSGSVQALQTRVVSIGDVEPQIVEIVEDGDMIEAGQIVCRLDTTELLNQLRERQVAYDDAVAALAKTQADVRLNLNNAATKAKKARQEQEMLLTTNEATTEQAEAQVEFNQSELAQAKRQYERQKSLAEDQLVPVREAELAELNRQGKQLSVVTASKQLEVQEHTEKIGVSKGEMLIEDARFSLEAARNKAEQQVVNAKYNVTRARQMLELAKLRLQWCTVKAPIAGLAISNGLRPGLAMVAKTLADELGPRGVRVNGLLPGRVDTDRVQQLDAASGDPAAARRSSEAGIPLRRYGRPEEFGRAAAFLLSPAASYVSGVMLPVDGGALRSL